LTKLINIVKIGISRKCVGFRKKRQKYECVRTPRSMQSIFSKNGNFEIMKKNEIWSMWSYLKKRGISHIDEKIVENRT
jgi:hypothetical protein